MYRKYLFIFSILFLGVNAYATADSVSIDKMMDFKVQTIDGEDVNFKSFLGKGPVLLNLWALWCEPCKQEMKAFKALVEKYKDKGVSMIAINTDKIKSLAKVRAYIKTQGYEFPVLEDPDGSVSTDRFSMESLPFSLIINANGTIAKKHTGFTAGDEATIEKELVEILGEK